jgi:hypothetical protein
LGAVKLPYNWSIVGWQENLREGEDYQRGEDWYFFIHRRELDQRYPLSVPSEKQPPQAEAPQPRSEEIGPLSSSEARAEEAPRNIKKNPPRREPPEYGMIRQKADEVFPQGYDHIKTKPLVDAVSRKLGKNVSRYMIERALGRRSKR